MNAPQHHADTVRLGAMGSHAPPRRNGELQFEAPWEARAFGVATALADAGVFSWAEFREALISEISEWEACQARGPAEEWHYYELWLAALQRVIVGHTLSAGQIQIRMDRLAHEPDHEHEPGPPEPFDPSSRGGTFKEVSNARSRPALGA